MRYSKTLHVLMTDIGETMSPLDHRLAPLQQWTITALHRAIAPETAVPANYALATWESVSGDASFRRYFRTHFDGRSYIIMDAPPEKESVEPFVDIAQRLLKAGLRAPIIVAQQQEQGFLLLEDLGDEMLKSLLNEASGQPLMDAVLPVLATMASSCDTADLPNYSSAKLQEELALFPDWYLQQHLGLSMTSVETEQWQQLTQTLIDNALAQPQVFVHRDFHSCNLHQLANGDIGVIDFQDAVCGPLTYDLASWLWDRYITWPRSQLESWMLQARQQLAPHVDEQCWIRWCDLMGLQRNLKIVGIFARLHYRDNKQGYLEMAPRFSDYIRAVLPLYPELASSRVMLDKWLAMVKK
jgi:aminoglycoside/choline kinase family phosphotransferase